MNKDLYDYLISNGWTIHNWPPNITQCNPSFIKVSKDGETKMIPNHFSIEDFILVSKGNTVIYIEPQASVEAFSNIEEMNTINNSDTFGRYEFMQFFRDDEKLDELTPDDRIEIFMSILLGSSDITVELLNNLLSNYNVENIIIMDTEEKEKEDKEKYFEQREEEVEEKMERLKKGLPQKHKYQQIKIEEDNEQD